jgi:hypothetical protein
MIGTPGIGTLTLSVCAGCCGLCALALIVFAIASWRTARRRGRRVELWSDGASRRQALLRAGASPAVAEQLVVGNKINAIKECRLETGLGLTEAKQLVDRYESALYRFEPWDIRQVR